MRLYQVLIEDLDHKDSPIYNEFYDTYSGAEEYCKIYVARAYDNDVDFATPELFELGLLARWANWDTRISIYEKVITE